MVEPSCEEPRWVSARGPRADTANTVLTAAFRILVTEGAHALSPQRLHHETGVARTTIYRHWPTTADLVATMMTKAVSQDDLAPFTGDLAGDLTIGLDSLVFRFAHRPVRAFFGALVDHRWDRTDPAGDYIRGLIAPIVQACADAVGRGELQGEPEALAEELTGPLLTRHVLLGADVTAQDAAQARDAFLARHSQA